MTVVHSLIQKNGKNHVRDASETTETIGEEVNRMTFRIMKLLLKAEKWVVKHIDNDSLVYEDCVYTIKKHENELSRIERESKL